MADGTQDIGYGTVDVCKVSFFIASIENCTVAICEKIRIL